jgi:phospho-N-acetylmuramoyl-pentapeptide-transferase
MLYWLIALSGVFPAFNVLRYITFRGGGAVVTGLVFMLLLGPSIVNLLRVRRGDGDAISADAPGTPTTGGLTILAGVLFSTLLWANLLNPYVWIVLIVTIGFGLVGLYADYQKTREPGRGDLSGGIRLLVETLIGVAAWIAFFKLVRSPFTTPLVLLFFDDLTVREGWFSLAFAAVVIVGAGHIVRRTLGRGGLAIVPVTVAAAGLGMIAYLAGNAIFAGHIQIHYVAGVGELAVLCGAAAGAGLGFLLLKAQFASVAIGDAGSLALGAMLGAIGVATRYQIMPAVIGGLFAP